MGVRLGYTNSKDGTKWPRIDFVNIVDGKMFLRIRSKYSPSKVTNLIEKGPYFKEITTVRKNKPVKENISLLKAAKVALRARAGPYFW